MIDWVDGVGRLWGGAKRRIAAGGYWRDEDAFHVDGHATRSNLAKLWEEREGASHQGTVRQHFPEVFTGEALAFEAAITGSKEVWHYLAHVRYVIPSRRMDSKSKMVFLQKTFPRIIRTDKAYYDELHALHCYMAGRMEAWLEDVKERGSAA